MTPRESRCLLARMPGLPLPSDDATKNGGGFRSADETCDKDTRVGLLPNEELSLQEYCKPVMLYEIFQARAIEKIPVTQLNFAAPLASKMPSL